MKSTPLLLQDAPDFSLVIGGPLFQSLVRSHLSGPALELVHRRVLAAIAILWLPLFILSIVEHHLLVGPGLSFLRDIETHVRLLLAVPVLILAEVVVHQRIRVAVKLFLEREIVRPDDVPKFHAAIESATRLRNSIPLELGMLVLVFTVGHWTWANAVALSAATWYAVPDSNGLNLTLPGYWFAFVSVPLAQFFLLRWYMRLIVWFSLLWRVSRLNLKLVPTHPDGAGGLGFLGTSSYAFGPILFAQSAMVSGFIVGRILYEGQALPDFYTTIAAFAGMILLMVVAPLVAFTPQLGRAKRLGLQEYGTLASSYVSQFEQKWIRRQDDDAILGTGDIQSLADLANSFAVVRDMRTVPFSLNNARSLLIAIAVPLLPLALTMIPLNELLKRLVQIIF